MSGNKVFYDAWSRFMEWEKKWSDELEGIEIYDRAGVYLYMTEGMGIDLAKASVRRDTRAWHS